MAANNSALSSGFEIEHLHVQGAGGKHFVVVVVLCAKSVR